ncbi:hypothetical protein LEP1GSC199_3518 [Leptospira vanthielii serovar Holland str. Waz Holland = ATCC 700522]|uniref:Uncharacterized protein n=1 Tax=Leptospira vanthielii serovar Holland str. Waz Holland = ATCC 700522 TaxID=1218591 RepID=N1WDZ9_9LEPT|nr:hypothetical protein LEP1GSC199_3518 [Leptospira vanthielii serovar Holland str. Waz Holland = ATCC 700522]
MEKLAILETKFYMVLPPRFVWEVVFPNFQALCQILPLTTDEKDFERDQ